MRGLRLFVRPLDASDREAVSTFIGRHRVPAAGPSDAPDTATDGDSLVPACGLLGKLLGDVVAIVSLEITPDALRVEDVLVSAELRRKRIGRAMLREVDNLALQLERRLVIVEDARDAGDFFRRIGFHFEGERWVREL